MSDRANSEETGGVPIANATFTDDGFTVIFDQTHDAELVRLHDIQHPVHYINCALCSERIRQQFEATKRANDEWKKEDDARQQFETIVHNLAESNPLINTDIESDPRWTCPHCSAGYDDNSEVWNIRVRDREFMENDHRPDCLWLQAKRLVEK